MICRSIHPRTWGHRAPACAAILVIGAGAAVAQALPNGSPTNTTAPNGASSSPPPPNTPPPTTPMPTPGGHAPAGINGSALILSSRVPLLPQQPSLGYGVVPVLGAWGPHFAPFAELRLQWQERPDRGFGDNLAIDPSLGLARLRLGALWYDGRNTALVQLQGAVSEGLEDGGHATNRHRDVHLLFYNRSGIGDIPLDIRAGRQELTYGDERLIGTQDFTPTGRSWDGGRFVYGTDGNTIDIFGTHTVNTTTPQPMAWLSGAWKSFGSGPAKGLSIFVIEKNNDGGTALSRTTPGIYLKRSLSSLVGVEVTAAGQLGTEAGKDVHAYAGHATLSETPTLPASLRGPLHNLTFYEEGDYASGSGSKASNNSGTFDNLYPTPHNKFGFFDYEAWKNMTEVRLGVSANPRPRWLTAVNYYNFGLASAHDYWYRASQGPLFAKQNLATDYGTKVGQEADLTATWQANKSLQYQAALCQFYPGDFAKNLTGKQGPSTLVFLQATYDY